jgi:hypothetical protein
LAEVLVMAGRSVMRTSQNGVAPMSWPSLQQKKDVDARHKAGHDEGERS